MLAAWAGDSAKNATLHLKEQCAHPESEWVERAKNGSVALEELQQLLWDKTFLEANKVSVADLAVAAAIHPKLEALKIEQRLQFPNVCRWFDLIQHAYGFKVSSLKLLEFAGDVPEELMMQLGEDDSKGDAKDKKTKKKDKKANKEEGPFFDWILSDL